MVRADEIADIAIIGAGLSGKTAALAFGAPAVRGNFKVILLEGTAGGAQREDLRALAITQSSRRMFETMGLWTAIAPYAEPLREIAVSDGWPGEQSQPELMRMEDSRAPKAASAYFVESAIIQSVSAAQVKQSNHIRTVQADLSQLKIEKGWAEIETATGEHLRARLIIAADGKDSPSRAAAGIDTFGFNYPQMGIVTTIEHELAHSGRAHERFLPGGPFAVLPLKGKRSSVVWTEEEHLALGLVSGSDERFLAELHRRLGNHLGNIKLSGAHQAYPLSLMIAKSFARRRTALVGDAAHVIHPLAGLGFNLGMRDIAALAEAVVDDARLGLDIGADATLEKYESRRRIDTMMNAAATDWLNRLFSNDYEALKAVRDLGLKIVDRMPPVKSVLMREAAGLTGDLPKLMKGEVL
jgi:2-octaprenyl-6-methoxyphenol hydroxylase